MKHYVCQGDCGGESKAPGVCSSADCTHYREALVACECADGAHDEALFGGSEGAPVAAEEADNWDDEDQG